MFHDKRNSDVQISYHDVYWGDHIFVHDLSRSVVMKRDTRRAIGIWAQMNGFIQGVATERGEDGCMQSLLSKVTTD